jgi:hypothetical protein
MNSGQTTDEKQLGVDATLKAEITAYRAEALFLESDDVAFN